MLWQQGSTGYKYKWHVKLADPDNPTLKQTGSGLDKRLLRYGRLKFFQEGASRNRGQSVVSITLISYTPLRYVRNVAHVE